MLTFNDVKDACDKKLIACSVIGSAPLAAVMPVFATEGSSSGNINSTIETAVGNGFQSVLTDVNTLIGSALPYALGIMGIMLSLRLGVKFFKQTSK